MLIDSILVIAGIVVFMIPAILLKEKVAQFKVDFPVQISKFAILSGFFKMRYFVNTTFLQV